MWLAVAPPVTLKKYSVRESHKPYGRTGSPNGEVENSPDLLVTELARPRSSGGGKGAPPQAPAGVPLLHLACSSKCLAWSCSLPSDAAHSHVCPIRESTSSQTLGINVGDGTGEDFPLSGRECPPDPGHTPSPRSIASRSRDRGERA